MSATPYASPPLATPWVPLWPLAGYTPSATKGAHVYHSANQSPAHGVETTLAFDSELWDTDGIHDPVTNNSRLTCVTPGKYIISLAVVWASSTGGTFRQIQVRKNGSQYLAADLKTPAGGGNYTQQTLTVPAADLTVGDYVEARAAQDSGAALAVLASARFSPEFSMLLIPPSVIASGSGSLSYGTTLPASPVDGQEHILVDSVTAPTYQWRFRYNASSSSAYKWEFVGGPKMRWEGATVDTITSGTYANLPQTGAAAQLVVPRAGDYEVSLGMRADNVSDGQQLWLSFKRGASAAVDADGISSRLGNWASVWRSFLATNFGAGGVLLLQAYTGTSGARIFDKSFHIQPVRVS